MDSEESGKGTPNLGHELKCNDKTTKFYEI